MLACFLLLPAMQVSTDFLNRWRERFPQPLNLGRPVTCFEQYQATDKTLYQLEACYVWASEVSLLRDEGQWATVGSVLFSRGQP